MDSANKITARMENTLAQQVTTFLAQRKISLTPELSRAASGFGLNDLLGNNCITPRPAD
jgi:hypothetical protein